MMTALDLTPAGLASHHALVLGLGNTGWSCVRWLRAHGARVRVSDTRSEPPFAARLRQEEPAVPLHVGESWEEGLLAGISMIVVSPGVELAHPLLEKAQRGGIPLVGDIELFAQAVQAWPVAPRVVGITGSNGKTTVTALVGAMANAAGLRPQVAGNIGTPVLESLLTKNPAAVYVLELSSFQLETTHSLRLWAGAVLNLSEDHLDRHGSMLRYARAKARLLRNCALRVGNRQDPWVRAMFAPHSALVELDPTEDATQPQTCWFGLDAPELATDWGMVASPDEPLAYPDCEWVGCGSTPVVAPSGLRLRGRHNLANLMAALALADALEIPRAQAVAVAREFAGLPHRVELVAQLGGVSYLDDSKGTNVGATLAALTGFAAPVVLIAGGEGKGQDFSPLKGAVERHARAVILIGRAGPLIRSALEPTSIPLELAATLEQAVVRAAAMAHPGDQVLLSPACASFDMFRDYRHRAAVFVEAVQALGAGGAA